MSDDPETTTPGTITDLLIAWSGGEPEALDELMPLVYDQLRGMAANHMRNERTDHTLQTSALINEAFLRLVQQERVRWHDRTQFFALAARMMRRILVDHARHHGYAKRDSSDTLRLSPEAFDQMPTERPEDLVALDDALEALAKNDPLQAKIIELRYFGGLTQDEMVSVLGISTATIGRNFRTARARLYGALVKGVAIV